jgi:hypothetical protein
MDSEEYVFDMGEGKLLLLSHSNPSFAGLKVPPVMHVGDATCLVPLKLFVNDGTSDSIRKRIAREMTYNINVFRR